MTRSRLSRTVATAVAGSLLAAAVPAPGQEENTEPSLSARIEIGRSSVYEREVFELRLVVTSLGIRLGQSFELRGLPPPREIEQLTPFRELPIEREQVGTRIREVRRFRCRMRSLMPGDRTIAPVLHVDVLSRQASFFGPRWVSTGRDVSVPAAALAVVPLPEAGRPPHFSGAVGRFDVDVSANPTNVAPGDLIRITTTVTGSGYLADVDPPRLEPVAGLKMYEPESLESGDFEKRTEQIVIPLSTNVAALPAVQFDYFDPSEAEGRYRTWSSDPVPLRYHQAEKSVVVRYQPGSDDVPPDAGQTAALPFRDVPPATERLQHAVAEARQAYDAGRYGDAARMLESLAASHSASAALRYNLGAAYLMDGRYGHAILCLVQAHRLQPRDPLIHRTLRAAQKAAGVAPPPRTALQRLAQAFSPGERQAACVGLAAAALILLVLLRLLHQHRRAFVLLPLACLAVLALLLTAWAGDLLASRSEAVALESTAVRFGPSPAARSDFEIPAGTRVFIRGLAEDWARIRVRRNSGWVPAGILAPLRITPPPR